MKSSRYCGNQSFPKKFDRNHKKIFYTLQMNFVPPSDKFGFPWQNEHIELIAVFEIKAFMLVAANSTCFPSIHPGCNDWVGPY